MAREWRDKTDRWLLGKYRLPLDVGTLVLAAFLGGETLAIDIHKLLPQSQLDA